MHIVGRRTDRNKSACTAEENNRLAKGITIIIANAGDSRIGQPFELLLNPWAGKRQPGERGIS